MSDLELREIARPGLIDDRQDVVNPQKYVRPCSGAQNEDGQLPPSKVLLMSDLLIRGNQYLVSSFLRPIEQVAIAQLGPT